MTTATARRFDNVAASDLRVDDVLAYGDIHTLVTLTAVTHFATETRVTLDNGEGIILNPRDRVQRRR